MKKGHIDFSVSKETLAEMERLKTHYGVTTNTEVLRRMVADRMRPRGRLKLVPNDGE